MGDYVENVLKVIKENYAWIIAVSTFLFSVIKGSTIIANKRKISKVIKYINTSNEDFFEFSNIENKLKIDSSRLREILSQLELAGFIKDSPVDGARKYHFFFRI